MVDTNVRIGAQVEPEEDPRRFNRRRVVRVVTILVLGILAVLAIWDEPLSAGY